MKSISGKITAGLVAVSMFGASAASAAPTASYSTVNPMVALSMFASSESRVAVCGLSAALVAGSVGTAATASAAQAAPGPGCVLPAVDAVPVPVAPPVAVPVALAPPGFSISPFLLGLGAIALGIGLLALLRDNDNNDNNPPISPA